MCFSTLIARKKIKEGHYRATLLLDSLQGLELPFNFDVVYEGKNPHLLFYNAEEKIKVDEISFKNDSVLIKMPVFDTEFRCRVNGNNLEGIWINHYRSSLNRLKFRAVYGVSHRFAPVPPAISNNVFEGKWEVTFSPGLKDSSKAVGIFNHVEQTDQLKGTFLTETGDYRFLDGMRYDNQIFLSSFDGSRAYLFKGQLNHGVITGKFYSGAHWKEDWIAVKNPDFELRDAEKITFVKDPLAEVNFSFNDLKGNTVSLGDERYKNKPVIVQIMGSWCPNCMDESRYLSEVYKKYNPEGLEILGLAFEKTSDAQKAKALVQRMKDRLGIPYEILLSLQTGKDKASASFPFLNSVSAFPTTIFLNRKHQVVKIHTGFSGPATGKEYEIIKQRTENLIKQLIKE